MNYYGYIYLIIDQKHNKIYVGQKRGRIEDSLNYFGSGRIIKSIIKKRGTSFLKKIVLGTCETREELLECEKECKYFFNAFDRKYGYNIAINDTGGDNWTFNTEKKKEEWREKNRINNLGRKPSKESINKRVVKVKGKTKENCEYRKRQAEKLSKKMKGKCSEWLKKPRSERHKQRVSEAKRNDPNNPFKKGFKGNKNGMYGKNLYTVWLEKYGEEEANKRHKEYCEKLRKPKGVKSEV